MGVALILIADAACYMSGRNYQEKKWRMFILTIVVSTFINVGTAFQFRIVFSYSMVLQLLYVFIDLLHRKRLRFNGGVAASFVLFILSVAAGFVLLLSGLHRYLPIVSASVPQFGYDNISAFVILLLFCAFALASRTFFKDEYWVRKTRNSFIKIYRVYFVCIIVEFILNNFVSPNLVRNLAMTIFGEPTRGYMFSQQRNNMYSINSLFSEPSYVVVSLFYFAIILRKHEKSGRDIIWNAIGILCMILSGASMGIAVIPFAVLTTVWSGKRPNFNIKLHKRRLAMLAAVGVAGVIVVYTQRDTLSLVLDSVVQKFSAYLFSDIRNEYLSGTIRQFGNSLAYAAFLDMPLFGYGLGTTRGYGIIPGALAALGTVGCITYGFFMKKVCCVETDFTGWVILLIFLAYGTSVLSVWYLYEPTILLLFFAVTGNGDVNSTYAVSKKYNEFSLAEG